jgi:hypothetical protein
MTAEVSTGVRSCGQCGKTITAGNPLYRITAARLVRCEACAWMMGGPLPQPQPFVSPPRREAPASTMLPFPRPQIAATLKRRILDSRERQAGEREPGEDG